MESSPTKIIAVICDSTLCFNSLPHRTGGEDFVAISLRQQVSCVCAVAKSCTNMRTIVYPFANLAQFIEGPEAKAHFLMSLACVAFLGRC